MWFGTERELYRYDSKTFKKYKHNPKDPRSIASDYVHKIYQDSKGNLWMAAGNNGLCLYNRESDSFTTFRHDRNDSGSLTDNNVKGLVEDNKNNLWVATALGLNRIIFEGASVKIARQATNIPYHIECIVAGQNGELWLGTTNGLFKFKAGKTSPVGQKILTSGTASYSIYSMHLDKKGNLWLGTSHGLVKYNTATESYYPVASVKRNSLLPAIYGIAEDHNNKLWLASESGLAFFDQETSRVKWHLRDKTNPNALVDDALMSIHIDQQRGLWVGAYYQGISYMNTNLPDFSLWPASYEDKLSDFYLAAKIGKTPKGKLWAISVNYDRIWISGPGNTEGVSTRVKLPAGEKYYAFFLDDSGTLWCGGNNCLFIKYDLKTGKVLRYSPNQVYQGTPLPDTKILMLYPDKKGRIWISGWLGLICFNPHTGRFQRIEGTKSIHSILEDSKGNLWFSGEFNIYLLESNSSKISVVKVSALAETGNQLYAGRIAEDDSGRIWATSNNGLLLYDNKNRTFLPHTNDSPELLNYVQGLQIDSRGNLWLCNENKLICYHPEKKSVKVYDYRDGLPYGGFLLDNASLKDNQGNLYFPTSEGTFRFNPDKITDDTTAAPLTLTSLKLFNKEVRPGDRTALLDHAVEMTKEIIFRHDQNIFTLDFALLNNARSERNQYAYFLENFEHQWNYVQSPSATYTNLPPGTYMFLAKAANGDGFWNPKPLRLKITILPPWWKTWYAYLCYMLLIATGVYAITRYFWLRSSLRRETALNQIKLDFFTNVSHEIRTHLSLISAPLEKAFQHAKEGKSNESFLNYAKSNSDRLLLLVNELLDFRKIQSGNLRLLVGEHDIVKVIKSVTAAFEHISKEKDIQTLLFYPDRPVLLWFDIAQMQKVFYNLLSNAYKFTPEGGKVQVRIAETYGEVLISVEDNGKGISPDHLRKLFTYYYQVGADKPGYGIGLALSKSIVQQHYGYLTAESRLASASEPGGTTLNIRMLRGNSHFPPDQIAMQARDYVAGMLAEPVATAINAGAAHSGQKNTILIIEDNDQLRVFIRELFEETYNILEAGNGLRGVELAQEKIPDIILSDVMMPEISGLEVCNRLKKSDTTSHIPVVLLTARTQSEQVIEGLTAGADDYLVKPFDPRILEIKINNLLRVREQMKARYRHSLFVEEAGHNIAQDLNEAFINKLRALVIENISDAGFGVHQLAFHAGMSVSVLYRKMRSLTGMTVNEFVKTIRLNKAKTLLESGAYQVSEVATIIGFEDVKYFSKEFTKVFGRKPNEIKKQMYG
ncbi:histidine kinase [Dyadobacter fermentans DSM 18053]|uniref:histidine kinase n=2 Tax=Dyadobacter fermentans TaxID=94254 RepID=C6VW37_DYAFD|nr:histidine kinase [Dyadobacter fermentans DSM 18053]